MADIFVSCEHSDQGRARRLVDSLRAVGYKVSTEERGPGSGFSSFKNVAGLIASSKLVLTIWTRRSVNSERVIDESKRALQTGKYIGVVLDDNLRLPGQFHALRTADMTGKSEESEEFDWLCETIDAVINSPDTFIEPEKAAARNTTLDIEAAVWQKVAHTDKATGYEFYLNQFGRRANFGAEARERLRELTTWWYRLNRFTNAGWVKAVAALTIVCGAAALFAMSYSKSNMVSQQQYAEVKAEREDLSLKLAAANDSRLSLIASFGEKVSRSEYVALSDRARELEEKLNRSAKASTDRSTELTALNLSPDSGGIFAQLDAALDGLSGTRGALENALSDGSPNGIEPASGSAWTCTMDSGEGISFGSTCWPRTTTALALQGFGIETATDLTPVELMRNLETLEVAGARLSDLDPLSSMGSLRELNISGTAVDDIGPLASLTELEFLDLRGTAVSDLSPLKEMTNLQSFCAPHGPCTIDDIEKVQRYLDENAR